MSFARPALTGSIFAALFCAPAPRPAPPVPASGHATTAAARADGRAAAKPTLLVFITVDQMREDYLEKWRAQFSGGLKRLLAGGAFFTNGFQDHAITETAPGHASTMSGRFPRSTGITRNAAGVNDTTAPLLSGSGLGASPFRFRGTTLTDWLTAADPRSRALSVSYKDRGAILPIGRSKQQVFWYAGTTFTTSRYYADTLPDWIKAFNDRRMPQSYAGRVWSLLLPEASYPEPDSVPIENRGANFMMPKMLPADSQRAAQVLPNTPFMDEVAAALALDGLVVLNLGKGPETDILAVSFSATDLVGHGFGPDSRELHDQILRLDRTLGGFIDSIYKLRDSAAVIFALTADHGVAPFPELSQARFSPPPRRVNVRPAVEAARAVIRAAGADTNSVELESGALIIDRAKPGITERLAGMAADTFVVAAKRIQGVLRAERFGALSYHDLKSDYIARRWLQMIPPDLPVDAVVVLTAGSYWDPYPVAMHGTPHDYDAHVPILFYGPPFKTGRYPQLARTVDIAPTLAQVLGVVPGEPLDGHVLKAAIR